MTKPHAAPKELQNPFARACQFIPRVICALACFPHEAFREMRDWGARADVLLRGFCVVLGPTAGGIALFTYARAVFGDAPFLFMLPFVAFMIDWRITGSAYDGQRHRQFAIARSGVTLISCLVAATAALFSEQTNLIQGMRVGETKVLEQGTSAAGAQYIRLQEQLAQASSAISENEKRLQRERPTVVAQLNAAQMLYQKECYGASGVDSSTGVRVVGGRCGQRAAGHKAEADRAHGALAELDQLVTQNGLLQRQMAGVQREQKAILASYLTPAGSVGSLFKSIQYADIGTWIAVGGRVVVLVFCELLCLVLAGVRPPQNVIDAVSDLSLRDARRLEIFHAASIVELNCGVPPLTFDLDEAVT